MTTAVHMDLRIDGGATFSLPLAWCDPTGKLYDLTGGSARMMFRESVDSDAVLYEAASQSGEITVGGALGAQSNINLEIDAAATAAMAFESAVYDLLVTAPDGKTRRLIEGKVWVRRGVTRE